jgi:hypothetical protein
MPDWLIDILRQFPIVVVIGFAIWYTEKRVREKEIRLEERFDRLAREADQRSDRQRQEEREDKVAEIKRHEDMQRTLLAAKDEQIAALTKQLAALTKKLSG